MISLPAIALRNHQTTLVLGLALVLLGLIALLTMPRSEDPVFDFPSVNLTIISPGTSTEDLESLVVDPIEAQLSELEEINKLTSDIEDGLVHMEVEFHYGSDPDEKFDDVTSKINQIRGDLPDSIVDLDITLASPADVAILQLALTSASGDFVALRHYAEQLELKLEQLAGVKRVDIAALPEMEVQVIVDQSRSYALGISLADIQQAIQSSARNLPGGHAEISGRRLTVIGSGDFADVAEIAATPIPNHSPRPIRVSDVAEVKLAPALATYRGEYQGLAAVYLGVVQREGSNIFSVTEAVDALLATESEALPPDLALHPIVEQHLSVEERINGFFNNLLQGLLLVGVVTLLVLGWRLSLVVIVAIPVSIIIAIGWLDLSGFGLQQMSIVGLVIALGLLVDNAIVVAEGIQHRRLLGEDPERAAISGSSEVATAVASGTLTTILAFVPMLLMQNSSGQFIRSMPVTVVLTLLASLLVALTLTPLLARVALRRTAKQPRLQRALQGFAAGGYATSLRWSLRHPLLVLLIASGITGAGVALLPQIGVSLFPKAEKPMVLVNIDLADGAPLAETRALARQVGELLQAHPLVADIATNIGRGNPRIYYNVVPNRQRPNFAQLLVRLHSADLAQVEPFVEQMRTELDRFPGARIRIKEFEQGPPKEAPISFRLIGDDWDSLREAAALVSQQVEQHSATVNVENPIGEAKVDLHIVINREKAAMAGVPLDTLDQIIRAALVGWPMGEYRDALGDSFNLVLRTSSSEEPDLLRLEQLQFPASNGALIPFRQLATLQLESALPKLQHFGRERMARITADVRAGYNTAAVTGELLTQLDQLALPKGVQLRVGGEQENREESFGGMARALVIASLGIFLVLVMQFHSFSQPMIIFATIPFAVTGSLYLLWLTGQSFSFTAFVGLTSLVGIVVNNAIILVDRANQLLAASDSPASAVIEAAKSRLVPILLTSVTTIFGLLPLTLSGSTMWTPMGSAIIGGLLLSTLLSLFVVPVIYRLITTNIAIVPAPERGYEKEAAPCGAVGGVAVDVE
jgi:multidrug efflux pump subunit AcrB